MPANSPVLHRLMFRLGVGMGSFGAVLGTTCITPVHAQDRVGERDWVEEVIVTATKRETALQDTSLSISVLTQDFMEQQGFSDLESFANSVPSLEFSNGGTPGLNRVTIRGISSAQGVATVGMYFDDLPATSVTVQSQQPDLLALDVERVEILRGPQGTLFGEGAMGGAIRFISNKPDPTRFQASAKVRGASIEEGGNSSFVDGMVNVPLGDTLALRAVAYYQHQDGWIDNNRVGKDDTNLLRRAGARLLARWLASDSLTVTATVQYSEFDMGDLSAEIDLEKAAEINQSQFFGLPFIQEAQSTGFSEEEATTAALTVEYAFSGADLTFSTSWFERDNFIHDPVPSIEASFGLFGFDPYQSGDYTVKVVANELRVASASESRLQWILGAFHQNKERDIAVFLDTQPIPLLGILATNFEEFEQFAVFGELIYHFSDKFQGTVGLRYAEEDAQWTTFADFTNFFGFPYTQDDDIDSSFSNVLPKFSLGYGISEDVLLYATASKGYRSGGFNLLSPPGAPPRYDQDQLWSYEIGWKTEWNDGLLLVNGAIYYTDWTDYQAVDLSDPFLSHVTNIGNASTRGLELEVVMSLTDNLTVTFGGNVAEAEMRTRFVTSGGVVIEKGNELIGVPDYTFNASWSYSQPLAGGWRWAFRGTWQFVEEVYSTLENDPEFRLPSYQILNLRTGIESDRYTITLFADNITDEKAIYGPQEFAIFGSLVDYTVNRPRTIGVELSARFH